MDQIVELALAYDDVLLEPQLSRIKSRSDVDLSVKLTSNFGLKIPIISANMSDVTGLKMAISMGELGGLGVIPRFTSLENQARMVAKVSSKNLTAAGSVGIKDNFESNAQTLVKAGAKALFLDVAHGHTQQTLDAAKSLKNKFGQDVVLVTGNVATYAGAKALFKAGADVVKVGIGPGSICTTRIETGSGVPQITAVINAAKAAKEVKKTIICDGGIKNSGDVVKGLAAGATAVMIGSLLAATDKAPGKLVSVNGKKYKQYNASTSLAEKVNHQNSSSTYLKQIEGVSSRIPYVGTLEDFIERMCANVRSGFSYSGAMNLDELWQNARFVRITNQGLRESRPHDVEVVY